MKKTLILSAFLLFMACETQKPAMTEPQETQVATSNPLLVESNLPYYAPEFDKIKDEHYLPALETAIENQKKAINSIANQRSVPTFDNTLLALEKSKFELDRISNIFFALTSANTNDRIKEIQATITPKLSELNDELYLNTFLFNKIKGLYEQKDKLNLDAESYKLLTEYYKNFVQAGANLDQEKKDELKSINSEIANLQTQFNQTLLKAIQDNKIVVKDKAELEGLSDSEIDALKDENGNYTITLINTTQQPILSNLKYRKLRQEVFEKSWNRNNGGKNNTNQLLLEIAKLRAKKGEILGYKNFAEWSLANTMAQNPEAVENLFQTLASSVNIKAKEEAADIQNMMKADGITDEIKPWDWAYYTEKVRKAKYDLDESEMKPYFELNTVLEDGVFYAATELYGITFKKRNDIPTYHPDVQVYEVFDADGTPMALFYGDYFARESKRGGAWMSNFVTQSKLENKKPVIYNVCNYQKPAEGKAALISYDDVTTLFHEFGHALHGLFANQYYPSLSGTNVVRDFVEYPSQANEHWILNEKVLKNYAKHYQTGETIPDALIQKIKNSSTFNQGFATTEVLAASDLDLIWHSLSSAELNAISDPNNFEMKALTDDNLWNPYIPPRYRSSYFAHIFGGGYGAGYYSYLWTEMLAADSGKWFDENGGLNRENGQRYRDYILSKGNTEDYKTMYRQFRGSDAKPDAMLESRGLK